MYVCVRGRERDAHIIDRDSRIHKLIRHLYRSSGGPKLYFEGDGTTFAHCFISSLRHHHLRHHRPRAVLWKDAQNMQAQHNW